MSGWPVVVEVPVTRAEARGLIVQRDRVHTFQRLAAWAGADMDRSEIMIQIDAGRCALSTEGGWAGHWLVVEANGQRLLVETDAAAVARIRERLGVGEPPGARIAPQR